MEDENYLKTKMIQKALCPMLEFILRLFNKIKPEHTWFLDPTQAVIIRIEKTKF